MTLDKNPNSETWQEQTKRRQRRDHFIFCTTLLIVGAIMSIIFITTEGF